MNKTIRVLHVVTHMNRGGLETMIMNYYRMIDRNLVQFDFLTHRPEGDKKDYDDEIVGYGGRIFHIRKLNPFSLKYRKELMHFFNDHPEFDIIHVHQDCFSGVILKIAKRCGIKTRIAHCHSSNQDHNIYYPLKLVFKHNIFRYSTHLFACSETAGKWMFGKKTPFEVLPNAIDCKKYIFNESERKRIRNDLHIPNDTMVVGLVARFSQVKNHQYLIRIFDELVKLYNNCKLVLIGAGSEENKIKELVASLKNIDNKVLFLGKKDNIYEQLQAFDFFVMPSIYEGLPLSIVEAQASGLKCFVSDNVSKDCDLTSLIQHLSLKTEPLNWAKTILNNWPYKRRNMFNELSKKGFDIQENATRIQRFYLGNEQ